MRITLEINNGSVGAADNRVSEMNGFQKVPPVCFR